VALRIDFHQLLLQQPSDRSLEGLLAQTKLVAYFIGIGFVADARRLRTAQHGQDSLGVVGQLFVSKAAQ
jgi:hypothetical protein